MNFRIMAQPKIMDLIGEMETSEAQKNINSNTTQTQKLAKEANNDNKQDSQHLILGVP